MASPKTRSRKLLFVPNFDVTYKTIERVSVASLKLFGPIKTWVIEVREFPFTLYGKIFIGIRS